ncbi:unnamed protein product [Caenorhabditis auriculariae]|uniref:Protein-lysine N-methyltransferase CAUJ_LOCUS3888 n=1 Tax=Caenorhabditis auriculariae TaxID=2777116 RepID=A0A8S1GX47_9PELO|nr:unnamed protein product [Caenorhabditis auriculariae]
MSSNDEIPQLSPETLTALQQWQEDQRRKKELNLSKGLQIIDEDWQLSQFWYDDKTARSLVEEAVAAVRGHLPARIACVSSPTLVNFFHESEEYRQGAISVNVFEYDTRFAAKFPSEFVFYDYKQPSSLALELHGKFDFIVADPPFLAPECLIKVSHTIRLLGKEDVKILLCTGAVMEEMADRLLGLHRTSFQPRHAKNLANDFASTPLFLFDSCQWHATCNSLSSLFTLIFFSFKCIPCIQKLRRIASMAPTGQGSQWSDVLCCIVCNLVFDLTRLPVNLACGHVVCKKCTKSLKNGICPIDETKASVNIESYPSNMPLLSILDRVKGSFNQHNGGEKGHQKTVEACLVEMAKNFKRAESERGASVYSPKLSRTMQRKLVSLLCFQLAEEEGRSRAVKACRAMGERIMSEILLGNQSSSHVSSNLWTAVRARGCQFLGPAMQEDVLRLILITLENGALIARKTLVMYVVTTLSADYPQVLFYSLSFDPLSSFSVSKTCVGHVVQLLYRASCFNVLKRDGESSLMQLKEEFRTYSSLRREHDAQIVQMALEAGLRISPDQWSALLYADQSHRSHMQSIIDKLQSPNSYSQALEELSALGTSRSQIVEMVPHLKKFQDIHPTHHEKVTWQRLAELLSSMKTLINLHISLDDKKKDDRQRDQTQRRVVTEKTPSRFKTKMCSNIELDGRCSRGTRCTYAHTPDEIRDYRVIQYSQVPRPTEILGFPFPPPMHMQMIRRGRGLPPNMGSGLVYNHGNPSSPPMNMSRIIPRSMGRTPVAGRGVPPPPPPMLISFPTDGSMVVPPNQPPPGPPPQMQMMPVIMQSPTHMSSAPVVMMPGMPNQPPPPVMITSVPPPQPQGPPPQVLPQSHGQAVWPSPTAGVPPPMLIPAASPPHHPQQQFWIQNSQGSLFPIDSFEGNGLIWGPSLNGMRDSGQDAEQLLLKRNEILNRLTIDEDDNCEDGIGHVSYTVASSVLDDSRVDIHHPIALVSLKTGQTIELPAIPVTFSTVPTEETMNIIGDLVQNRPRAPSLPHVQTSAVLTGCPKALLVDANTSATVQADCSTMSVMESISQPIAAPSIQKSMGAPSSAAGPTAVLVDGSTGLLTPVMRPVLVAHPQDLVSNSLDKIIDVKERISEAQAGSAPEAVSEHLRMELRMAESEMAFLDPFTKNNCLLRELQQVDRELQQLQIEPTRAQ